MTAMRKAKFEVYPLNESLGYILHRLDTLLAAALDRAFQAQGLNLTSEQFGVLSKLWEGDGMHQTELSDKVSKDKHNVTRILNLLEKNGFVQRVRDAKDRRLSKVHLTQTGRAVKPRVLAAAREVLRIAARGVPPEDILTLGQTLQLMVSNMEGLRKK